jgi:hypothetical protein
MGPIPDVPAETARLAAQASIFSRYAELASKPKVTPEDMDRALEIEILNIGTSEDGVPDRGEGIPAAQRYHRMPGKNGG